MFFASLSRNLALPLLVGVALVPAPARADYYDGGELKKMFDARDGVGPLMARAYVAGVQDMSNGTHLCVPENVRLSQVAAIVDKYLTNNPEQWHKPGKQVVIDALISTFPCKRR